MTYLEFHLRYNLPPLLGLILANAFFPWNAEELTAMVGVMGLVMLGATPWDAAAVRRGIWDFTPGRHGPRLWRLPVEEYAFFILQGAVVMLVERLLLRMSCFQSRMESTWSEVSIPGLVVVCSLTAFAWILRWWRGLPRRWHYAWHLLAWTLPLLATLVCLAPGLIGKQVMLVAVVTGLVGSYYTWTDVQAVKAGVWFFDETQITGWKWRGILPWEEAAFFYLTSTLVAVSYLLLLPSALR